MPDSLNKIGKGAFSDCTSVLSFNIPEGVAAVPENTFSGCSSLKKVYLPKSLEVIGANAFAGCTSLCDVYYADNMFRFRMIDIEEAGNGAIGDNVSWHFNLAGVKAGDVNLDNKINARDSIEIRMLICGRSQPDEMQFCAADVNCDTKLNVNDSKMLSSLIVGRK